MTSLRPQYAAGPGRDARGARPQKITLGTGRSGRNAA